ncbi:uncharacterized protein LOC133518418 isoform X5 [Cydia pomonella]|uniref:uncharacterized protein LOC133518418 isoform X5 n=1 Tax=Cydia pomonella TaxID=82600 RepID=UPI002ADD5344|nr:uncharacterized protein LOC133518418 isoform X5 [Cydia pomonella]
MYLQEIHITITEREKTDHNTCRLELSENTIKSFELWTQKLGPSVVGTYCNSLESLAIIKENCPNIEALKNLLHPNNCSHTVYVKTSSSCNSCLSFRPVLQMEPKCILSLIDRLGELTTLKLACITYEILEEMQLVLDKMPKLEWLELYDDLRMSCHSSKPLSRLTRLKHLKISCQLGDCDVEAVTRCCPELTTLDLPDCQGMTSDSVEHICRHLGARLTWLSLGAFYEAEDDDVLALVRGCPELTFLFVGGTGCLTPALPARAAAARRDASPGRRLLLDLACTNLTDDCYLVGTSVLWGGA